MMAHATELRTGHSLVGIRWLGSNDPRSPPSPRVASSSEAKRADPGAILIVEDDWFIASDIRDMVAAAGYRVTEIATTADEAVAAAVADPPDLVLMDIRLVGPKDGIDAALDIRDRVDSPCLLVSAHRDARLQARAAAARPRGWLMKPFSNQQLLAAIEDALRSDACG
jgi:two-component system, response regulator PdtaR